MMLIVDLLMREIDGKLVNQEIAEANLDELKKLKDFQSYNQVEDVEQKVMKLEYD